jgi:Zinc finger found in FPG and IleRS
MTAITITHAVGTKCKRCWKVLPEVGEYPPHPDLCLRCVDIILKHDTGISLQEAVQRNFDLELQRHLKAGMTRIDAINAALSWYRKGNQ